VILCVLGVFVAKIRLSYSLISLLKLTTGYLKMANPKQLFGLKPIQIIFFQIRHINVTAKNSALNKAVCKYRALFFAVGFNRRSKMIKNRVSILCFVLCSFHLRCAILIRNSIDLHGKKAIELTWLNIYLD
jgi:hypothetical protein